MNWSLSGLNNEIIKDQMSWLSSKKGEEDYPQNWADFLSLELDSKGDKLCNDLWSSSSFLFFSDSTCLLRSSLALTCSLVFTKSSNSELS